MVIRELMGSQGHVLGILVLLYRTRVLLEMLPPTSGHEGMLLAINIIFCSYSIIFIAQKQGFCVYILTSPPPPPPPHTHHSTLLSMPTHTHTHTHT